MAQSKVDNDPWGNYYFSLEINKVEIAHFMECSGLKSSATVFEIEEGGMNGQVHKRSGYSKWENIVLKKAVNYSDAFIDWRDAYLMNEYPEKQKSDFPARLDSQGAIIMRDNAGKELRRYTFSHCWPVSWEGPSLNSGGSELSMETLEIAHDGLLLNRDQKPPDPQPDPVPAKLETEPVQFDYDSAKVKDPEGTDVVDDVDKQMDDLEIEEIWVEGHTCSMGSDSYNQKLSQERADAVADGLKKEGRTVHSTGYGEAHPVASNSTSAGRAKNRRTEFWTEPRVGLRAGELK